MNQRAAALIGGLAGLAFVVLEATRQALAGPPPVNGTAAEIVSYATQHESLLRVLFPFVDAVGAASFLIFAIVLIEQNSGRGLEWLARIAGAGAILTFGVSLLLDGLFIAYVNVATGAVPETAPAVFAGVEGVESLFPYTLAMFLIATAGLMVATGSRLLGWTAAIVGAGFLVSGLLPAVGIEAELEGPMFMVLLVWIVAGSALLLWRPTKQLQTGVAGAPA